MNPDDELQISGKYVAHKLRTLKGYQQIFARKLISDVIYEGELESLTKHFKVMNCLASAPFPNNQILHKTTTTMTLLLLILVRTGVVM